MQRPVTNNRSHHIQGEEPRVIEGMVENLNDTEFRVYSSKTTARISTTPIRLGLPVSRYLTEVHEFLVFGPDLVYRVPCVGMSGGRGERVRIARER